MKKRLYLHVGPHKTGTTVIQKACIDNRNLLEQSNVKYPEMYFNHLGHHGLVDAIRGRKITDEDVSEIAELNCDILLSSENFINLAAEGFEYFKSKFCDFTIEVIFSWRRSSHKMYSMWQESIKQGSDVNYNTFYYKDLVKPGQSERLSQNLLIGRLVNVFGKENVHILDYENLSNQDKLVDAFFEIVGVEGDCIDLSNINAGIRNSALDPVSTEIIRCLNSMSIQHLNLRGSTTRELFFAKQKQIAPYLEQLKMMLSKYQENIQVGDYFVDNHTDRVITRDFGDLIVEYKKNVETKNITIISPNWLILEDGKPLLKEIHNILFDDK
tara:strand:- start:3677 stop:4657 length:981 start_codon:yes stop_codon:yes gene_type:complete